MIKFWWTQRCHWLPMMIVNPSWIKCLVCHKHVYTGGIYIPIKSTNVLLSNQIFLGYDHANDPCGYDDAGDGLGNGERGEDYDNG